MRRRGEVRATPESLYIGRLLGLPLEGCRCFYANLSTMLPHRPHAYDAGFDAEISHSGMIRAAAAPAMSKAVHHSQICPNCTHQLSGHHCKLVCTECGYYLSCADYY